MKDQSKKEPSTCTNPPKTPEVDRKSLESELRRRIKGEVRFDQGSRALYSTDASNYRQIPIGVVIALHLAQVILMAMREGEKSGDLYPERRYYSNSPAFRRSI